jgi:hypothetical protein
VNLALAILLLWLGALLLTVAFHPLASGSSTPGAVLESLESKIADQKSAYNA